MKTLILTLLITHIAAGFTALLVGLIPMFFEKGNRLHKRAGLIYVYCMIVVAATAMLLCVLQPFKMMRLFLAGIAVFSFLPVHYRLACYKKKELQTHHIG